jgi:prevent-host-death family protein
METRITCQTAGRHFGEFSDKALVQPVVVTKHGRNHVVIIAADEYERLKRRDRRAYLAHELPDDILEALKRTDDIPAEAYALNHEVKGWTA